MLLIKKTGVVLASWVRDGGPTEVLPVMSATLLASVDTISEALGYQASQTLSVETDQFRILAARVDSLRTLFLIAPRSVGEGFLRHNARQLLVRLGRPEDEVRRRSAEVTAKV